MRKTLTSVVLALTVACGGQQPDIPTPAPVLPDNAVLSKELLEQIANEKANYDQKILSEIKNSKDQIITWQEKQEGIYDSVVCLRSIRTYSDGRRKKMKFFYGTGFPISRNGDLVYIATNQHVAIGDQNIISSGKVLPLVKSELFVITQSAPYIEDNIPLEILNSISGRIDTAVLLGYDNERLLLSRDHLIDPDIDIRLGEEVFSVGCLGSSDKVVNYGHIANINYESTEGKSLLANLSITHGQSGGPVFLRRDNDVYLIGHVRSFPNKKGGTAYSIITSIKDLYPIWYEPDENGI